MPKIESDIKSLLPLEPYLMVLLDKYPDPMRPVDLAEEIHYSKAAITKIRTRLLDLCDKDKMLFGRGFVLKPNLDIFLRSFIILSISGKHRRFLASNFAKMFLRHDFVHRSLKNSIPFYENHFTENDTGYMIHKVLEIVENIDSAELSGIGKALLKKPSQLAGYALAFNLPRILPKLKLSIKDQHELQLLFVLRDKIFYLLRDNIWVMIEDMKILKTLDDDKSSLYKSVYKHTIEFYLMQFMESVDESIRKAAEEQSIKIKRPPPIGATPLAK